MNNKEPRSKIQQENIYNFKKEEMGALCGFFKLLLKIDRRINSQNYENQKSRNCSHKTS
jgi:hypothetical protein